MKKIISLLLAAALLLTLCPAALAENTLPQQLLQKELQYYHTQKESRLADDYWELAAAYAAEDSLSGFALPKTAELSQNASAAEIASYMIKCLLQNRDPSAALDKLQAKKQPDGSYGSGDAAELSVIILAIRAAQPEADLSAQLSFLCSLQKADGSFSWSMDETTGDVDTTALAVIALSPYAALHQAAVDRAKAYLVSSQLEDGGFGSAFGGSVTPNSNSTALAVCALVALSQDVCAFQKNGKNPFDALSKYQTATGGFDWSESKKDNDFSSKQVLMALADFKNGKCILLHLPSYDPARQSTITATVTVTNHNGLATRGFATLNCAAAEDFIAAIFAKNSFDGAAAADYTCIIDNKKSLRSDSIGQAASIWLVPKDCTKFAFFTTDQTLYGTPDKKVPLTLNALDLESGAISAVSGAQILIDGNVDYAAAEQPNGSYSINVINGGTYSISAKLPDAGDYMNPVPDTTLSRPYLKLIIDGSTVYTRSVSLRIEGQKSTLYNCSLNLSKAGGLPTVKDALDASALSYTDNFGMLSSVSGENPSSINAYFKLCINGTAASVGYSACGLNENDEVLIYCCGYDPSTYIDTTAPASISFSPDPAIYGKSVKATVCAYKPTGFGTPPEAYNVPGAAVTVNGKSFVTGSNGAVTIPATSLKKGENTVLFAKDVESAAPEIVRGSKLLTVGASSGSTPSAAKTVSLKVVGKTTLLAKTSYDYEEGLTPYTLLQKSGLDIESSGSGSSVYVRAVEGLEAGSDGASSGWMYSVNGTYPQAPAASYTISAGDYVQWIYTKDGGSLDSSDSGETLPSATPPDAASLISAQKAALQKLQGKAENNEFELIALALGGFAQGKRENALALAKALNDEGGNATDYAKAILCEKALGLSPRAAAGIDLPALLYNFEKIEKQGTNAAAFSLISFDGCGLTVPQGCINSRQHLIALILAAQNADGGFALTAGQSSDADITSMCLYALSPYMADEKVNAAIQNGLKYLSAAQLESGGFASMGSENCESSAQAAIALCALGISAEDPRFCKKGGNVASAILSFKTADGFSHLSGGVTDDIATCQAAIALSALIKGSGCRIYDFSDNIQVFRDLGNHQYAANAAVFCAQNGIMSGYGDGSFGPSLELTRAELSKIITTAFALQPDSTIAIPFTDVGNTSWYAPYIGIAYSKGLVGGFGDGSFLPDKTVTREELAVILFRSAKMAGIELSAATAKSPPDIDAVSDYAKEAVIALYSSGILGGMDEQGSFCAKAFCTRAQIAIIILNTIKK